MIALVAVVAIQQALAVLERHVQLTRKLHVLQLAEPIRVIIHLVLRIHVLLIQPVRAASAQTASN